MVSVTMLAMLWALGPCLAAAASSPNLRTIYQFPNQTWIENMAVRANGQIMGTDLASSRIYLVDPTAPRSTKVIHQFPARTCLTGITELDPDVFIVQSLICDIYQYNFVPNTTSIWKIDMRQYARTGKPAVSKIGSIVPSLAPNGNCVLSQNQGTILVADSGLGSVVRFNTKTGASNVVFSKDSTLAPIPSKNPPFGVDGIHVVNGVLYYTNVNKGLFVKVPVSLDGTPTAKPTVVASNLPGTDDFTLDVQGNAWVAQNSANRIIRISPSGQVQSIVGSADSKDLPGPVRPVFGRGPNDRHTLYISTNGLNFDANGTLISDAAKIAAIDTDTSGTPFDP